jgi:hypothetical protein
VLSGTPAPAEREEVFRIWRDGNRVREEHEGGPRDGAYAVRSGDLWWSWNRDAGALSNQDDPRVGSAIGQELSTPRAGRPRGKRCVVHRRGRDAETI